MLDGIFGGNFEDMKAIYYCLTANSMICGRPEGNIILNQIGKITIFINEWEEQNSIVLKSWVDKEFVLKINTKL